MWMTDGPNARLAGIHRIGPLLGQLAQWGGQLVGWIVSTGLPLAGQALANGKKKDALQQATRAKQLLPRTTVGFARAEDIHREAEHLDN